MCAAFVRSLAWRLGAAAQLNACAGACLAGAQPVSRACRDGLGGALRRGVSSFCDAAAGIGRQPATTIERECGPAALLRSAAARQYHGGSVLRAKPPPPGAKLPDGGGPPGRGGAAAPAAEPPPATKVAATSTRSRGGRPGVPGTPLAARPLPGVPSATLGVTQPATQPGQGAVPGQNARLPESAPGRAPPRRVGRLRGAAAVAAINTNGGMPLCTPSKHLKRVKALPKRCRHMVSVIEAEQQLVTPRTYAFRTGDVVEAKMVIPENGRKVAVIRGVVIARRHRGLGSSFTLIQIVPGMDVLAERIIPLYSPHLLDVTVIKANGYTRSKMFWLKKRDEAAIRGVILGRDLE